MKDLEQELIKLRPRKAPADWKRSILEEARSENAPLSTTPRLRWDYWAFAAVWVAILTFSSLTSDDAGGAKPVSPQMAQQAAFAMEMRLAEIQRAEESVPPRVKFDGANLWHRRALVSNPVRARQQAA